MSEQLSQTAVLPLRKVPRDIIIFGIVMIVSGFYDVKIILDHPEYELPIMGMKFGGVVGRMVIFLFPLLHFVVGYGVIRCRRWAYYLFIAFASYGIISPTINYFRMPPPHRIRTILLIGSFMVLAYLYKRRAYFKT